MTGYYNCYYLLSQINATPKQKYAEENIPVTWKQCKVLSRCHKQFGLFEKLSLVSNQAKIQVFIRKGLSNGSSTPQPVKSRIVVSKDD